LSCYPENSFGFFMIFYFQCKSMVEYILVCSPNHKKTSMYCEYLQDIENKFSKVNTTVILKRETIFVD